MHSLPGIWLGDFLGVGHKHRLSLLTVWLRGLFSIQAQSFRLRVCAIYGLSLARFSALGAEFYFLF